jgi:GTP-binding protein
MFVDEVRIVVRGGNGGNGCISFRREKFVPKGGPDGGDGGMGGSVILRAVEGESSLVNLYYLPHYEGGNGGHGMGRKRHGACGSDRVVHVPVGTVVRDSATGETVVDLREPNQEHVVARGGKGGLGNTRFVSSTRRAPRISTPGTEGEEKHLELELRTIADIGLVGYPNAGKSTFLTSISDAHPKTAPYPFTTLNPVVGVVSFDDYSRMTVADIPGLVEGAHENVGLGHAFLRHIERARVLVYVLDLSGIDGREPWDDLVSLQRELKLYDVDLAGRLALILANKVDVDGAREKLPELSERTDLAIVPISALTGLGVQGAVGRLRELLKHAQETTAAEPEETAAAE